MNDGTSEVTKAAFRVLVFQIKQLTKERDEARREVCRLLDKDSEFRVPNEITAKRKGWDCFEKETQ